jgi:hypothetical protein
MLLIMEGKRVSLLRTRRTQLLHPEDGDDMFLRKGGSYKRYTVSYPRRRHSSIIHIAGQYNSSWKNEILDS